MASCTWIAPVACHAALGIEEVRKWRTEGFCLVDGLLPLDMLAKLKCDALETLPQPGSPQALEMTDFGGGKFVFPSTFESLNAVALHGKIQTAVATLLDVSPLDLRLTQAELWPKYGNPIKPGDAYANADQRMHCDFPNHTLTHPPPFNCPEAVEMIIYLSDVDECGGATAVVPRRGEDDPAYPYPLTAMPGFGLLEWINNKAAAEEYLRKAAPEAAKFRETHLYPREQRARYRFGTILLYRHDTWHRGTELKPGTLRVVMNLTFRKATSEWVSTLHTGWAWAMYRSGLQMERLVARSTVEARCLLGFPKPGHGYWTEETLLAVAERYGPLGMDMVDYVKGIEARGVDF